jgi:hypothetical protein
MEKVLMKWLNKLEYMLADTMPYKNEEPDVFETQCEDLNEVRELIKWCNGKADSAMGKYLQVSDAVIMKSVFAYARWLNEYGWKVDSEDGFWFRECEDELTPDISIEYTDEMVWAMFNK